MNARAVVLAAVGIIGSLLLQGCSTYESPVTGQEARYGFQTLKSELDVPIPRVYAAARSAMEELDLRLLQAAEDGISGQIRAVDAQWEQVDVRLGALPCDRTLLSISIGPFGDKKKSIVLFEHIVKNLCRVHRGVAPAWHWKREYGRWDD